MIIDYSAPIGVVVGFVVCTYFYALFTGIEVGDFVD